MGFHDETNTERVLLPFSWVTEHELAKPECTIEGTHDGVEFVSLPCLAVTINAVNKRVKKGSKSQPPQTESEVVPTFGDKVSWRLKSKRFTFSRMMMMQSGAAAFLRTVGFPPTTKTMDYLGGSDKTTAKKLASVHASNISGLGHHLSRKSLRPS